MIVLIGFMGAGKTSVGRSLAEKIGLPFIDTDQTIEQSEGRSIKAIFEEEGEGRFRALETETIGRVLEGPDAVVSLGGGAIHDPTTCAALGWHDVIFLDVGYPEAMRRLGHDPGRPLLHVSDPRALFDDRKPIYQRVAKYVIDTADASVEEVVDRIVAATGVSLTSGPATVTVQLGPRSYPVIIGTEIAADAAALIDVGDARQAFVITHPDLAPNAKPLTDSLNRAGIAVTVLTVPEGEGAKSFPVATKLLEDIARARAHRADLVVGFGGGVVCDVAGFVGSTYHRGMPVLHVPTTLLAQVDAAVGGKTALNLDLGKNLVGTIHQPVGVLCDVSLLQSLPEEELRSGLAEVVKYGLISDPSLLDDLVANSPSLFDRDQSSLSSVVQRSVAIKASVVASDEREQGRREILNYGHTFGHAIEHVTGMRHGEAIAIGMMAAADLARQLEMLNEDDIERHRGPLAAVGLPISASLDLRATLAALQQDKKHRDRLRFVLLEKIGLARTGVEATDEQVENALRSVAK
ncbi:MAG: 3-dehydroquinate synthase [Actinobacteria bacterium]|nr:3-dehydroquinate synthase [Actinomycetota bacterium]